MTNVSSIPINHPPAPRSAQPLALTGRWKGEEAAFLTSMLDQPSLFYWKGPQTARLIQRFREAYPFSQVMPCSSGTAAIHIAVAAAGIEPGDEVIVPPITDMGTVIGILYQQGVPVFADIDPHTYNLDVACVKKQITSRTRAIVAVHLAGNPCAMDDLKALAQASGLILIEDCAQAWGARWEGNPVGMMGDFGCYSFNDFKHVSCGDGGIVGSSDARFGSLLQRYGDKGYDRVAGTRAPEFLAPNYRISEPQSAVAAAQMARMEEITSRRAALGTLLNEELEGVPGIDRHRIEPGAYCTFWFYLLRLRPGWRCTRAEWVEAVRAQGVNATPGYIPAPLYRYPVFENHHFFGTKWPVRDLGLTSMDYREVSCPVAEAVLDDAVYLKIHEGMETAYIKKTAEVIRKLAASYAG